jgi:hypothetical protein
MRPRSAGEAKPKGHFQRREILQEMGLGIRTFTVHRLNIAILAGLLSLGFMADEAVAQSVFQKIGDGWKNGKWLPGFPNIRPQTWQEVLFPVCWGSPQKCRDDAAGKAGARPAPLYSVSFTVDCQDVSTTPPTPRGDTTLTFVSTRSIDDAESKAIAAYQTSDLCQQDPNYKDPSRTMVPGSGHFDDDQQTVLPATVSLSNWCHQVSGFAIKFNPRFDQCMKSVPVTPKVATPAPHHVNEMEKSPEHQ